MAKLRVAVLGAGFMGSTHARALRKLPTVELVAVTSQGPERGQRLAADLGTRWVDDPAALVAGGDVDAIDNCLPTPEHAALTIGALRAGKHVLVEKPIALTLADADAMLRAWRASSRVLMVAHVLRFWPEYVALHDMAAGGELGRPVAAAAWRMQAAPAWSRLFGDPARTGGAVVDLQIHDYDQLNWIFGRPRSVSGNGLRGAGGGWEHNQISLTYDGAIATAEGSNLMPGSFPFTSGLRVRGESGCLEYSFRAAGRSVEMGRQSARGLTYYPDAGEPRWIDVPDEDGYEAEVAYFVECALANRPAERASPDDAYLALETALAAKEALDRGNTT